MALKLIAIHPHNKKYIQDGVAEFSKRIQKFAPYETIIVETPKKWHALAPEQLKEEEGQKVLNIISPKDHLILLDERGKQFTSQQFAQHLDSWLANTMGNLYFAIGGAYGFSPAMYDRANGQLSLSKMTTSHQLIRLIFTEQLYRALTILNGHPYHND